MGHERRYDIYDLILPYFEPLVEQRWRLEVEERMDRSGNPLRPPDLNAVRPWSASASAPRPRSPTHTCNRSSTDTWGGSSVS